jgi:hypothetical protein
VISCVCDNKTEIKVHSKRDTCEITVNLEFFVICFFETGSFYVAQAGLEPMSLLAHLPNAEITVYAIPLGLKFEFFKFCVNKYETHTPKKVKQPSQRFEAQNGSIFYMCV